MLQRSGRGHDSGGINATGEGECAALCPACPQPGKNLLAGWIEVPPEKQWLYGLFVAIDANFRLKRKVVSSDVADPGLSCGWAYFVEETAYKSYLVNAADTKGTTGLTAIGVGTVDCTRHGFKLPCGVGDLQKGEKYVNMDYILFSALRAFLPLLVLKISYDIACQWMMRIPEAWHVNHRMKDIMFLVPKFHLPAHITKCQWLFSFNLACVRKKWAPVLGVTRLTITSVIGTEKRIQEAVPQRNDHCADFMELTESLSSKYPDLISAWEREVREWEYDPTKPNPFEVKSHEITQASICLRLAMEDTMAASQATQPPLHVDVTPSVLINTGIELEEQQ
ncbi:hypothetical protein EV363DRAFT_1293923 [Boletus edulis]|nr:hypothetical protein EV363DRAFT_1293923 [Boletus edulis]